MKCNSVLCLVCWLEKWELEYLVVNKLQNWNKVLHENGIWYYRKVDTSV